MSAPLLQHLYNILNSYGSCKIGHTHQNLTPSYSKIICHIICQLTQNCKLAVAVLRYFGNKHKQIQHKQTGPKTYLYLFGCHWWMMVTHLRGNTSF